MKRPFLIERLARELDPDAFEEWSRVYWNARRVDELPPDRAEILADRIQGARVTLARASAQRLLLTLLHPTRSMIEAGAQAQKEGASIAEVYNRMLRRGALPENDYPEEGSE